MHQTECKGIDLSPAKATYIISTLNAVVSHVLLEQTSLNVCLV